MSSIQHQPTERTIRSSIIFRLVSTVVVMFYRGHKLTRLGRYFLTGRWDIEILGVLIFLFFYLYSYFWATATISLTYLVSAEKVCIFEFWTW
jgi:hypothetical protein